MIRCLIEGQQTLGRAFYREFSWPESVSQRASNTTTAIHDSKPLLTVDSTTLIVVYTLTSCGSLFVHDPVSTFLTSDWVTSLYYIFLMAFYINGIQIQLHTVSLYQSYLDNDIQKARKCRNDRNSCHDGSKRSVM